MDGLVQVGGVGLPACLDQPLQEGVCKLLALFGPHKPIRIDLVPEVRMHACAYSTNNCLGSTPNSYHILAGNLEEFGRFAL